MRISSVNENTIMVYFSDTVSPATAEQIASALPVIQSQLGQYVVDIVPSYTSILISFDLVEIGLREFTKCLQQALVQCSKNAAGAKAKSIELPVYYGPEVALDADEICAHTGLTFEEVIQIHASTRYRVYAIGFAPGFAYLGNTDPRIEIPRKQTPRLKVPAGSLALADRQTAIYPKQSPGGWQVIGRTPISLIDFERENLTLFEMGAEVAFTPIDKATFLDMGGVLLPEEIAMVREVA
ncbi:allophanate hydrolase subunit 1 [Photobacterium sanctipauli]|uniref:Allophanate hydrolase subunit 1 n=1 Tax=Photobacterium sanctipauli TaxID=1342794 RepID=A0A2T3NBU2_9GAMM|nr:5-oxoprolinase subunit PxpB [Photobacterium sanctipauli]PSW11399.1 allophanate hydrolase subunit 1 [Photobacterium sanctipauli]